MSTSASLRLFRRCLVAASWRCFRRAASLASGAETDGDSPASDGALTPEPAPDCRRLFIRSRLLLFEVRCVDRSTPRSANVGTTASKDSLSESDSRVSRGRRRLETHESGSAMPNQIQCGPAFLRPSQPARPVRSQLRSGGGRCPSGSSKLVRSGNPRLARFDSGAAPLQALGRQIAGGAGDFDPNVAAAEQHFELVAEAPDAASIVDRVTQGPGERRPGRTRNRRCDEPEVGHSRTRIRPAVLGCRNAAGRVQ